MSAPVPLPLLRRRPRGVTLIEAAISLAVFAIGMVGILQLQIVAARSNTLARKLGQASALAQDLGENVTLWPYDDVRLAAGATVTGVEDTAVGKHRADSRKAVLDSDDRPHFADFETENADEDDALSSSTVTYQGLSNDVDGDGERDFERYWNVFAVDANGDGTEEGKLVVVVVRWFEGGIGYRRIERTVFRSNPMVFAQ